MAEKPYHLRFSSMEEVSDNINMHLKRIGAFDNLGAEGNLEQVEEKDGRMHSLMRKILDGEITMGDLSELSDNEIYDVFLRWVDMMGLNPEDFGGVDPREFVERMNQRGAGEGFLADDGEEYLDKENGDDDEGDDFGEEYNGPDLGFLK